MFGKRQNMMPEKYCLCFVQFVGEKRFVLLLYELLSNFFAVRVMLLYW